MGNGDIDWKSHTVSHGVKLMVAKICIQGNHSSLNAAYYLLHLKKTLPPINTYTPFLRLNRSP